MELLSILPVLMFSIVVHEVAHAWVALKEGDDTAQQLGRITLNPISHLDPMGSVVVPLVLYYMSGGMIFGWAKPVPIDPTKFRNFRGGDIRVSLAGIVSNLILVVVSTLLVVVFIKLQAALPVGESTFVVTLKPSLWFFELPNGLAEASSGPRALFGDGAILRARQAARLAG